MTRLPPCVLFNTIWVVCRSRKYVFPSCMLSHNESELITPHSSRSKDVLVSKFLRCLRRFKLRYAVPYVGSWILWYILRRFPLQGCGEFNGVNRQYATKTG